MNPKREIYVSTDVEADGPIPGVNSMLSFGSAAYLDDKTLISTFTANLETLPGAEPDPKTMEWWKTQPAAWTACRENPQPPEKVLKEYVSWLKNLPGRPVFVGYPAAYDFLFVYWYLIRFTGESPFSHSALDIKTLAMPLLKRGYREATKRNMPKRWFSSHVHTHKALDDAIEQGELFCNILCEIRALMYDLPVQEPEVIPKILAQVMSDISEDYYCAGWLIDLEYMLWEAITEDKRDFGFSKLADAEIAKLKFLSQACGGWVYYDDEKRETFISKDKWLVMYADWKKRSEKEEEL